MVWFNTWQEDDYLRDKQDNVQRIEQCFPSSPIRTMLDIGCGLAYEARHLHSTQGTQCDLMDRGAENNQPQGRTRHNSYGTVQEMQGYHSLAQLQAQLDQYQNFDYRLYDADDLPDNTGCVYDLVYSSKSMGLHYPADTHRLFVQRHSHQYTRILLELRGTTEAQIRDMHPSVLIQRVIKRYHKSWLCEIQYCKTGTQLV